MQNGKNFERSTTGCALSISPGFVVGNGSVVGFTVGSTVGLGFAGSSTST